jgi:nucleoside-diphosphate-sugar epimerase
MNNTTIAITGASGFIGAYLVTYLKQKGFPVIELGRHFSATEGTQRKWLLEEQPGEELLKGIDILIHCAFIKNETGPVESGVNYKGSRNLFDAAQKAGIKKMIFFSTTSAHEASSSVYGRSKFSVEKLLDTGIHVILKPGLVIGRGGLFSEMLQFTLKKKIVPIINGGIQPMQTINIEAVAEAVENCILNNLHGRFVLTGKEVIPYKKFFATIAEVYKIKLRYIPLPVWLLKMVIIVGNMLHIKLPVNKENLHGLESMRASEGDADQLNIRPLGFKTTLENMVIT